MGSEEICKTPNLKLQIWIMGLFKTLSISLYDLIVHKAKIEVIENLMNWGMHSSERLTKE